MAEIEFKGQPLIVTGICETNSIPGGQISVRLEHYDQNDAGTGNVNVHNASDKLPSDGDRGLIIFSDHLDGSHKDGYWIGSLVNRFHNDDSSPDLKSLLPNGADGLLSKDGQNKILVTHENTQLTTGDNSLILDNNSFKVNGAGKFGLSLDNGGFNVFNIEGKSIGSKLSMTKNMIQMTTNGTFLFSTNGDTKIRSDGNVIIGGNSADGTACGLFNVKSNRIAMDAGAGPIILSGSAFNVKLGSAKLGTSGGAPGMGPMTSASIEVIQGDIDISAGLGDITIRGLSPANSVSLENGFLLTGVRSYFEADGLSATMGAELVPGMGAYVECTRTGAVNIDSWGPEGINITSDTVGEINLSTNTIAAIKAMIQVEINGMTQIIMETLMLDLKGCTTIDAGPKIATPGPAGPFCSLPMCVLTGAPHVGSIAIG